MSRRGARTALATLAFAGAALCFGLGLAGRFSPWMASAVAALALLTVGFYLAAPAPTRRGDRQGPHEPQR